MQALTGKVAIVTGASLPNGIGLAIAKAFAKAGASLFLVAEGTREQLEASQHECQELTSSGRVEYALCPARWED